MSAEAPKKSRRLSEPFLEDDVDVGSEDGEHIGSPLRSGNRKRGSSLDANGQPMAQVPSPPRSQSSAFIPRQESSGLLQGETDLTAIASYGGAETIRKRPKRVSNYILGPVMGVGTYGVVRDAIDFSASAARRVAVKVIRTNHRKPKEMQALQEVLSNEAHHLQRFHHANVVRAIDVFSDKSGKEYMVLPVAVCSLQQLLDARAQEINKLMSNSQTSADNNSFDNNSTSIFKFTTRSLLPPQLTKDLIFQLLAGVQYLHSQGVCHNDLKFANTLLYADGTVKITDLGSCRSTFSGRGTTPAYVSPAVAAGELPKEEIDGKANDVWAVGAMLYYLATGKMPFDSGVPLGADPCDEDMDPHCESALYQRIATGRVNLGIVPSEINVTPTQSPMLDDSPLAIEDGSLRHLLSLLLEKDQNQRVTASKALLHPWLVGGDVYNKRRESNLSGSRSANHRGGRLDKKQPSSLSDDPTSNTSMYLDLNISSGSLKRVFNVKEISGMIDLDTRRHLQFVAELCHVIALPIPQALIEDPAANQPTEQPSPKGKDPQSPKTKDERISKYSLFSGCVSREAFMKVEEYNHYQKKGKPEADVKTFRFDPMKRANLQHYANKVFAFHGFEDGKTLTTGQGGKGGDNSSGACWCCTVS